MFETIAEGFVSRRDSSPLPVAAGPRCAVTPAGEVLCTFMAQTRLGVNDFVPLLTRSRDAGATWSEPAPMFPHLAPRFSLFGSIGPGLFFHGIRIPIDVPGESFWSDATQGMKQNDLFWSRSVDSGATWSDPAGIPLDGAGSAEAPCPLTVTSAGRWISCYSPYNNFDATTKVDRERVVIACCDDGGRSWWHRDAMRFPEANSGGAEAWVVELTDGRLLATAWHVDHGSTHQYPNTYALSHDGGATWTATRSTGILGQSTALTPLADGRALFVYNQRKHGQPGVRIALVRPTESDFGVEHDQMAWAAPVATQHATSAEHSEWTDFSFGEPSVVRLADGTLLLVFWCIQADGSGIRYVRLRVKS
ncbi:MAG: sialidase family protein [Bryobacteraceae bacterium]